MRATLMFVDQLMELETGNKTQQDGAVSSAGLQHTAMTTAHIVPGPYGAP